MQCYKKFRCFGKYRVHMLGMLKNVELFAVKDAGFDPIWNPIGTDKREVEIYE